MPLSAQDAKPRALLVLEDIATAVRDLAKQIDLPGQIVWKSIQPRPDFYFVQLQFTETTGEANLKYNLFLRPPYHGITMVRIEQDQDTRERVTVEADPMVILAYITF
jgi:hypothetical protein